jgi:hypothetical protein
MTDSSIRTARITLRPAYLGAQPGTTITEFDCDTELPATTLNFTTLDNLKAQVTAFANSKPGGWHASVFLTDRRRKPSGFDKALREIEYHNLQPLPEPGT